MPARNLLTHSGLNLTLALAQAVAMNGFARQLPDACPGIVTALRTCGVLGGLVAAPG